MEPLCTACGWRAPAGVCVCVWGGRGGQGGETGWRAPACHACTAWRTQHHPPYLPCCPPVCVLCCAGTTRRVCWTTLAPSSSLPPCRCCWCAPCPQKRQRRATCTSAPVRAALGGVGATAPRAAVCVCVCVCSRLGARRVHRPPIAPPHPPPLHPLLCPVYATEARFRQEVFTAQLRTKQPWTRWALAGAALFLDVA